MQARLNRVMENLAKRTRARREQLGLTQGEVAKLSGLKQPDVSKIERGQIQKTTSLLGLARALHCSPLWLDTGDGDMLGQPSLVSASIDATGVVSGLGRLISLASEASRDRAATLLTNMARDPEGPWAAWLIDLLSNNAQKAHEAHTKTDTNPGKPADMLATTQTTMAPRDRQKARADVSGFIDINTGGKRASDKSSGVPKPKNRRAA